MDAGRPFIVRIEFNCKNSMRNQWYWPSYYCWIVADVFIFEILLSNFPIKSIKIQMFTWSSSTLYRYLIYWLLFAHKFTTVHFNQFYPFQVEKKMFSIHVPFLLLPSCSVCNMHPNQITDQKQKKKPKRQEFIFIHRSVQ